MPLLLLASSLGGVLLAAPPASAQLTQNITMAATGSTTFDQSGSYNVDATTNDDDPGFLLVYNVDAARNTADCSVDGSGSVSFTSAGGCTIDVNSAATENYYAANQVQQTLTVAKATPGKPTISNLPTSGTYGDGFTATVSTNGDGVKSVTSNSTSVCKLSAFKVSYVGVGTCSLTAHVAVGTNYGAANGTAQSFPVAKATPGKPTISNLPTSGTYGDGFTATVSTNGDGVKSVTSNSTSVCKLSAFKVSYVGVGTCSLTAHVAAGTNYGAANGTAQSFHVGQGSQKVTFTSTAPSNATVGGQTYTVTATSTSGLAVTFSSATTSKCTVSGSTVSFIGAGTCTIDAKQAGNANYAAAQTTQSFPIAQGSQKVTITQLAPASATTAAGEGFTGQLEVSGSRGTVTYTQSSGAPRLKVSSSGNVLAPATLAAGTYRATGSDSDTHGDTGKWSFALTETAKKISQIAPAKGTTAAGKAFTGQLKVSGSHGAVTYAQSSGAPSVKVSSSGRVSAPATLAAGTYKAKGTERDSLGDSGSWSFALKVTATAITQVAPATGTVSVPDSSTFADQLATTGGTGTVTYTQSSGAPSVKVSSSGKVSVPATLAAGTYKATGSDSDTYGDTGKWSFALTVTANKITQVAPATATIKAGKAFTGQLKVSDSHGAVTYAQSTGAPSVNVSSSGAVSTPVTLAAGTYKATGSDSDTHGDTGIWSFALTVTANKITQVAPATATIKAGKAFTGQLKVSGSHGAVTYAQSSGAPSVKVSSSGRVSAPATLAAGTYKAKGTEKDSLADTGKWSFALTVTANKITQLAPATATIKAGKAFTGQLKVSGSHGAVTYAQSSGAPSVKVSSSGRVSAPATLAAGTYKAKGTERDSLGDTGIWSFTLNLTAYKITQLAPASATTAAGEGFTGQLEVSGSRGTVTFTQSNGAPSVKISSSGKVSTPATLAAGTYKATGSDSDTHGDTGIWSFALTVTANKITQVAPATATIKAGKAFTGQLEVSGSHGAVTYAQSSGAPHLKVSSSGKVSAPATLAAGIYKAKGTDRDSLGNTGTWSFTLKLTANKITQLAPTSATITAGKAFTDQLKVSGSRGTVTFTQSSGAQILTVSASGTVLAPEIFAAGIYKVTGTVRDSFGDIGTWSFTLTVDAAASALDLQAAMDLQRHNKPAGDVPSRTSEVWRAVSDVGLGSPDRSQRRR